MNYLSHPARLLDLTGIVGIHHASTTITHELQNTHVCLLRTLGFRRANVPKTGIKILDSKSLPLANKPHHLLFTSIQMIRRSNITPSLRLALKRTALGLGLLLFFSWTTDYASPRMSDSKGAGPPIPSQMIVCRGVV
jgi:hypothetical protein